VLEVIIISELVKSRFRYCNMWLGFRLFHNCGLHGEWPLDHYIEYAIPDLLLVSRRMEIVAEFATLPCQSSAERKQIIPNGTVIHYDGA